MRDVEGEDVGWCHPGPEGVGCWVKVILRKGPQLFFGGIKP